MEDIIFNEGAVCIPPSFVLKWARIGENESIREPKKASEYQNVRVSEL